MSHPVIVVLACLFAVVGATLSYYFVCGFREGRFPMRRVYPFLRPVLNGRETGYAYRDRHAATFWFEAGFNVLAVLICIGMLLLLISLP
jgi:hypothetical protein